MKSRTICLIMKNIIFNTKNRENERNTNTLVISQLKSRITIPDNLTFNITCSKVWMCGGRLLHIPCSHIGHIARVQPYTFQEGRYKILLHNYKRAAQVWMGPYIKFVYDNYKDMQVFVITSLHFFFFLSYKKT